MGQIQVAVTERDLDAFLREADEKGLTTPAMIDAIAKRREQLNKKERYGGKQIDNIKKKYKEAKTPEEKLNLIQNFKSNVNKGAMATQEELDFFNQEETAAFYNAHTEIYDFPNQIKLKESAIAQSKKELDALKKLSKAQRTATLIDVKKVLKYWEPKK